MSRELLKRALEHLIEGICYPDKLIAEIETYLAQPEPEPVAWMVENHPANDTFVNFTPNFNSHFEKLGCKVTPLYTTPPDQSARIAELITQRTLQESIIKSAYTACRELEERLAALQARDPVLLNEDEINEMVCDYSQTNIWEFARAIEQAVLKANHE